MRGLSVEAYDKMVRSGILPESDRGWRSGADVSVARGLVEDYDERHPGPGDIALVLEIARTSVAKDRRLARVYAAAGIPAYWIIDVRRRRLEVFEGPTEAQYPAAGVLTESQTVDLVIDGRTMGRIAVGDPAPEKVRTIEAESSTDN